MDERTIIYLDDAIDAAVMGADPYYKDSIVEELMNVPSAQPEKQWISCEERLPEYSGRYLVSVLDGIDRRTTFAPYHPKSRTWTLTGRMAYWKVIAWMPLPEPYKEVEHERLIKPQQARAISSGTQHSI